MAATKAAEAEGSAAADAIGTLERRLQAARSAPFLRTLTHAEPTRDQTRRAHAGESVPV